MEDERIGDIFGIQENESYREYQRRVLRRRCVSMIGQLDSGIPQVAVETGGALLIKAVIGAIGVGAMAEFARLCIIHAAKREMSICPHHDDTDLASAHPITNKAIGMCDECIAECEGGAQKQKKRVGK